MGLFGTRSPGRRSLKRSIRRKLPSFSVSERKAFRSKAKKYKRGGFSKLERRSLRKDLKGTFSRKRRFRATRSLKGL